MPSKAMPDPGHAEVAVGAVVQRGDEILLIRRGRGAAVGQWAIPAGRVESGERLQAAVAREVREETGLEETVGRCLGGAGRTGDGPTPYRYVSLSSEAGAAAPTRTA